MKPDTVNIINISTSYEPKVLATVIYGLGDDGLPYQWSRTTSMWELY